MIDVHMLTLPTDRQDWKQQMLDSLPDWVTVHVVPAEIGPISPQRLKAFRLGTHPYVSFVDPDDWTETEAWDKAYCDLQELEKKGYRGVVTQERMFLLDANKNTGKFTGFTGFKHHFCILRRDFVEDREALFRYDMLERNIIATPEVKQLPYLGYTWRVYNSAGRKERIARKHRSQTMGL